MYVLQPRREIKLEAGHSSEVSGVGHLMEYLVLGTMPSI